MEDKNKHNIFSKEEFFKAIDEKKALPPDADDFDKEAMEGLAMVKDRNKLDKVDAEIDSILLREKKLAGKRRNMYYFAAAASFLLIVGLFFILKDNTFKEDKSVAQSAPEKTEDIVTGKEQPAAEALQKPAEVPADKNVSSGEKESLKAKEAKIEGKLAEEVAKGETFASDVTTVNEPVVVDAQVKNIATEQSNESANGAGISMRADTKAGGKSNLDDVSKSPSREQQEYRKYDLAKKADENFKRANENLDKEADEKKTVRYETNTVWTTPSTTEDQRVTDQLKSKQQQNRAEAKPQVAANDNRNTSGNVVTSTSTPAQTQTEITTNTGKDEDHDIATANGPAKQSEEKVAVQQKSVRGSSNKHKKTRSVNAAYDIPAPKEEKEKDKKDGKNGDAAGYAYYSQTGTRDYKSPEFVGGTVALEQFVENNLETTVPDKKGTVEVEFTVKPDGAVDTSNVTITKPIKNCNPCSDDVKRMVKKMPKWEPALENGKGKVYRQKMSVPYESRQIKK